MHKVIQLVSIFLYNKNNAPFFESRCSLDLMKNQIKQKKTKFWNFKRKGYKAKYSFLKPFDKKKMFNGFKMFCFRCKSHVQEINFLPKNMFGCPLKFILGFSWIFNVFSIKPKYSYTIIYECEKSPLTHELSYIGLYNFFHLICLFHVNVIYKK
jgi:hypothetical protein